MNSLFNSALKQSSLLRRDLDTFSSSPSTTSPALLGQISASIATLSRTIDDYDSMARKELVPAKQAKAFDRAKNFKKELNEMRSLFDKLKGERSEGEYLSSRSELLGRRGHSSATPDNPYAGVAFSAATGGATTTMHARQSSLSSGGGNPGGSLNPLFANVNPMQYQQQQQQQHAMMTQENYMFRERDFASRTNEQLDDFLDRGRQVLGNLGEQRAMLKNTQRKLYSVANTLGISRETIRMVERRATQDKWVFYTGVVVFFGFCWLVIRWLR